MTAIVIFSTACAVFNIWLNVTQLSKGLIIGNVVLLIISIIFAQARMSHVDLSQVMRKTAGMKKRQKTKF